MYIENIVVGIPTYPPSSIFAEDKDDWLNNELHKTKFTKERFLPRILVAIGFAKSTSEIIRNKPDLYTRLDDTGFFEIKYGKRKCWILVGKED